VLAAFHTADALVEASVHATEESLDIAFLERAGVIGDLPRWRSIAAETLRSAAPRSDPLAAAPLSVAELAPSAQ
jgi:hypothetical protein